MKAKKLLKQSIKDTKNTIKMYSKWMKREEQKLTELENALEELNE